MSTTPTKVKISPLIDLKAFLHNQVGEGPLIEDQLVNYYFFLEMSTLFQFSS